MLGRVRYIVVFWIALLPSLPVFAQSDWQWQSTYQEQFSTESLGGGLEEEFLRESGASNVQSLTLGGAFQDGSSRIGFSLGLAHRINYTYHNPQRDTWSQTAGFGGLSLYYRTFDDGFQNPYSILSGTRMALTEEISLGVGNANVEPEGLFFKGAGLGMMAHRIWNWGESSSFRFGVLANNMGRLKEGLQTTDGVSRFSAGFLGVNFDTLTAELLGGFYKSPGKAADPGFVMNGAFGETFHIFRTKARPDTDAHYYLLRLEQQIAQFEWKLSLLYNHGRQVSVSRDGVRQHFTRKAIRGGLAYGSLRYNFSEEEQEEQDDQQSQSWETLLTEQTIRGRNLELSFIATTRDRNDADDDLKGYGPLQSKPAVAGGEASILLNVSPGDERAPFSSGASDNSPLASTPDYGNNGIEMGSLRFGDEIGDSSLRLDGFFNYYDFLRGTGAEMIVAMQYRPDFGFGTFEITASAAGAAYQGAEWVTDPYTGLIRKPKMRHYGLYRLGGRIRF